MWNLLPNHVSFLCSKVYLAWEEKRGPGRGEDEEKLGAVLERLVEFNDERVVEAAQEGCFAWARAPHHKAQRCVKKPNNYKMMYRMMVIGNDGSRGGNQMHFNLHFKNKCII